MSSGYFPRRRKYGLEDLHAGLVTACHILHHYNILDAFGHISVRSPDNPDTFWLPRAISPALVSSPDDLIEYHINDASPVEKYTEKGYTERYIHSEIYKKFPTINSVVYSHCSDVLPYCVSGVPLRASIHMAGFLGEPPVWDASSHYPNNSCHDLLVRNTTMGASLAAAFRPATSAGFIYSKVKSALPSKFAGEESINEPNHAVVLMRGTGFTTLAHGIEEAVYQAIYTKEAAKTQTTGLMIRNAYFEHSIEGKVDVQSNGRIHDAKLKPDVGLKYLSNKEAHDAWEANLASIMRPWYLWCREVQVSPLYRNDCPSCEDVERESE